MSKQHVRRRLFLKETRHSEGAQSFEQSKLLAIGSAIALKAYRRTNVPTSNQSIELNPEHPIWRTRIEYGSDSMTGERSVRDRLRYHARPKACTPAPKGRGTNSVRNERIMRPTSESCYNHPQIIIERTRPQIPVTSFTGNEFRSVAIWISSRRPIPSAQSSRIRH